VLLREPLAAALMCIEQRMPLESSRGREPLTPAQYAARMQQLQRRLGTADAVFIGLGSMLGAGVFAAFAPAAESAGSWLLVGLAIAAVVAACNALASAQLAARYPTSGGTYVYGREELGPWWGFVAGWSFVIGKTASCAAMALTFAYYVAPSGWERPVAALAVAALATVNVLGVTRTALLARVIVVLVLAALATATVSMPHSASIDLQLPVGPYGVLQSAGLLFFAFAGYARIATMGEEVRDPARSIPRAIVIALAITVVVYGIVGVGLLGALGPAGLAASSQPFVDAVAGSPWLVAIVITGAALASLGALLALIAGVGRTTLAMARESDLPRWLSAVHPRFGVPHRAELTLALVVMVLVLTIDVRSAIGFSSFGVLLYYLVANLSALHQTPRRYPRALFVLGAVGCVALVVTLPPLAIAGGAAVLVVGLIYRAIRTR
jgi:basic amino acid/polyamine antiporter, APA family